MRSCSGHTTVPSSGQPIRQRPAAVRALRLGGEHLGRRGCGTPRSACPPTSKLRPSPGGICDRRPIGDFHRIRPPPGGGMRTGSRSWAASPLLPRIASPRRRRLPSPRRAPPRCPRCHRPRTARARSMPTRSTKVWVRSLYLAFSRYHCMKRPVIRMHRVLALHRAQHVALADVRAGGAADIDLPFVVADRDRADILDHRLGAVARAAGGGELQLARAVEAAERRLDLLAPAPCCRRGRSGSNRCRCSSCRCGSSCPRPSRPACRGRAQTLGRSSLRTPTRSMRWPPVSLTSGTLYFTATCGDAHQLGRRGDAAGHFRHHREGAVLLDVGVHAVVDEAGVALVLVFVVPQGDQQRGEGGLAGRRPRLPSTASAANTAETDFSPCSRIACTSSGLVIGMHGT